MAGRFSGPGGSQGRAVLMAGRFSWPGGSHGRAVLMAGRFSWEGAVEHVRRGAGLVEVPVGPLLDDQVAAGGPDRRPVQDGSDDGGSRHGLRGKGPTEPPVPET